MRKSLFLSLLFALILVSPVMATHMMGGSIRWECLPNGNYRFILTNYQEINTPPATTETLLSNYSGIFPITLSQISVNTISPACNTSINCSTITGACYREHIYTSDQAFPTGIAITQAAPVGGWTFYTSHCCRVTSNNLAMSNTTSIVIRTTMYNQGGPNSPCTDNSPVFLSKPLSVIYSNTSVVVPHSFEDPDQDSMIYDFAAPWNNYQVNAAFNPGYSAGSPFYTPNVSYPSPSLNPKTGDMKLKNPSVGSYYYGIQAAAFSKCNYQLKSITYLEFYQTYIPSVSNTLPIIATPLGGGTTASNIAMVDTVYAGSLYQLAINASDPDTSGGLPQNIRFSAWGSQFDSTALGNSANCPNPPCASISPALPASFAANGTIIFSWQPSCDHIKPCGASSEYQFHFKVEDDLCPIRSQQNATLRLFVKPAPLLTAPSLDSLDADFAGNVTLYWTSPADPNGVFQAYCIYADTTGTGAYYLVDSLTNYQTNSYLHVGANANYLNISYVLKIYSGCGTASSGYSTGSNSLIASFVGIDDLNSIPGFSIGEAFPNPSEGNFIIPVYARGQINASISVFDLSGRMVTQRECVLQKGSQELNMDLSLPSGVYTIVIDTEMQRARSRVVIH